MTKRPQLMRVMTRDMALTWPMMLKMGRKMSVLSWGIDSRVEDFINYGILFLQLYKRHTQRCSCNINQIAQHPREFMTKQDPLTKSGHSLALMNTRYYLMLRVLSCHSSNQHCFYGVLLALHHTKASNQKVGSRKLKTAVINRAMTKDDEKVDGSSPSSVPGLRASWHLCSRSMWMMAQRVAPNV